MATWRNRQVRRLNLCSPRVHRVSHLSAWEVAEGAKDIRRISITTGLKLRKGIARDELA